MNKKQPKTIQLKDIEKLLNSQTLVVLSAVDKKIQGLEMRLQQSENRINQKLDNLVTTLDKFLKRMTDLEDEFAAMKNDINRMKKILREKLGVNLA
jgi:predicted  nucleic acid-binding Zn-ribbon protein